MFSTTHICGVGIDAGVIRVRTIYGPTLRRVLVTLACLVFSVVSAVPAAADPDGGDSAGRKAIGLLDAATAALIGDDDDAFALTDDPATAADPKFGPYYSHTTDSGTCADWADDYVNRTFQIKPLTATTYRVVEKFRDGIFVSFAVTQPSPGACDSSDGVPPAEIDGTRHGDFHGYWVMTITAPVFDPSHPACDYPCATTSQFLASVFPFGFTHGTNEPFFFHFTAHDQGLLYHDWKNASCDRGGNRGDIANRTVTGVDAAVCP